MASAGLIAFGAAFVLALLLTGAAAALAPRLGLVDHPGGRKTQASPIPLGGGVAVALSLAGALLLLAHLGPRLPSALLAGASLRVRDLAWVLAGGLLVFSVGLIDDWRELSARVKGTVEIAAALAVAVMVPEARISVLGAGEPLQIAITVVWIVGLTNAFNFLDNMDGLSAGVAFLASGVLAAIAATTGRFLMGGFFLALSGALAGFLAFNLPPARIFLGDAGSLLVGWLMATGSALFTYDRDPASLAPLGVPLLVFGVPIFDAVTVVAIRLLEGRAVTSPDRSHLSHRLVAMGMSPREAVGTIWLLTFVTGMGALLLYHVPPAGVPVLVLQAAGAFAVVALLERSARRKR